MNIHKQKKRVLISTLQDPKVLGDDNNTHSSQSLIFQEGLLPSFLDEEEAHLPWSNWQTRSNNDTTNEIGHSDLRILRSAERRSPRNSTQTILLLLEKEIDVILLQTTTKNRVESVPNLYDVFES